MSLHGFYRLIFTCLKTHSFASLAHSFREQISFACIFHEVISEFRDTFLIYVTLFILLPEKFLPFDWLRAEVFQHNLEYLLVKITVTMVTQNHQIISSHELRKNVGKISRF